MRNEGRRYLQRLDGVLLRDQHQLVLELIFDSIEYVRKQTAHDIESFVIVLLDCHFEIQAGELTQMSMRVGVFSSEYRADLKDSLEASAGSSHLLVELRRLGQTGVLVKVLQLEHVRPSFRGSPDQLRGVDLGKVALEEIVTKELADSRLNTEDALISGCARIHPSEVECCVLVHGGQSCGLRVGCAAPRVFNLERQVLSARDCMNLLHR